MTIYKVHSDHRNFQSIFFDTDDYLDVLDPSIGEQNAMMLPEFNKPVSKFWEPIELSYFKNEGATEWADISMWNSGLLLMNAKAYKSLKKILENYGEFLPCELHGQPAYIFNVLILKASEGAKVTYIIKNGHKSQIESINFADDIDEPIFKHQNDLALDLYCGDAFKEACDIGSLNGLYFKADLAAAL